MTSFARRILSLREKIVAWSTPGHRQALAEAYLPIVRGFLWPGVLYYMFVTWGHWQDESGWPLVVLAGISVATSVGYLVIRQAVLTRERLNANRLELACVATNLLMYSNVLAYMLIHFDASKLVYFVLMAAVFSISGVTARVTLASVATSIATLYWLASVNLPFEAFRQYVFIGVAASFASLGMATLLRLAILRQIHARLLANRLEAEARALSRTDSLTGIANRRAVFEAMDGLVESGRSFWLGILDLDGFKLINDIYGHVTGDELLREVVARLKAGFAGREVLFGRLGGDEFAILIEGAPHFEPIEAMMRPVMDSLKAPFLILQRNMQIGASAGFAHFPEMGGSGPQLYEMADYALYKAKSGQRGQSLCFTRQDDAAMRANVAVERALREGDLEAELYMVFQPQYSLAERKIVGFEALARWHSRELGMIGPDVFIPAAERSGHMHEVTGVLFEKMLAALQGLPPPLSMAFNLSAIDVVDRAFVLTLIERINALGIDPTRIEFEITETAVMNDFAAARDVLTALSQAGCKVALDDFGAGNSSLLYIDQLPLDKLKIDKGFVGRVAHSATSREIVASVISLCRRIGLHCVLEGVETAEEMQVLGPMGPDIIQGYLFGKPLTLEGALAALLRDAAGSAVDERRRQALSS